MGSLQFSRTVVAIMLSGFFLVTLAQAADSASANLPPNIVLILADDLGYSDLGAYGGEIETPNIDQLAGEGMRFSQFYNTSRCSTTRASLLTGKYPHTVQMGHLAGKRYKYVDGYRGDLDHGALTLAEILRSAGYINYMAGKWHLADYGPEDLDSIKNIGGLVNTPLKRGFDLFYGNLLGGTNYFSPRYLYQGDTLVESFGDDFYYTDAITKASINFIDTHQSLKSGQPFFLYVAYTTPHWPIQAREALIEKYVKRYHDGWDLLRTQRFKALIDKSMIDNKTLLPPRAENIQSWANVENKMWQARRMAVHAAMVEELDQGVGKIVNKLAALSLLDNTLIIFLSDNGASAEEIPKPANSQQAAMIKNFTRKYAPVSGEEMQIGNDPTEAPGGITALQTIGAEWAQVSNAPFRLYKSWVHEGGIATPLVIRGPSVSAGKVNNSIGHVIDIVPTIVDLLGSYRLSKPLYQNTRLHGQSLLSALHGEEVQRGAIFFEHEGNRAVRDGLWKLIAKDGHDWELYDMAIDRAETNNLALVDPERVKTMANLYQLYAKTHKVRPWEAVTSAVNPSVK